MLSSLRRFSATIDPQSLVSHLNRYIVGQESAKRAIAVAVRDRYARLQVPDVELRKEILPSNILLIGSSGCGKTEIARRLAALIDAPFVKVVATKYTEVGFVGDSTTTMVEELAEQSFLDVSRKVKAEVAESAKTAAVTDVARLFLLSHSGYAPFHEVVALIDAKLLDDMLVNVDSTICPYYDTLPDTLLTVSASSASHSPSKRSPTSSPYTRRPHSASATRSVSLPRLLEAATDHHSERLLKQREVSLKAEATTLAETRGIIFIDEFDKLVEDSDADDSGSFKSKRRGVQKELLTLIEGSAVQTTKLGRISTEHVLFICAGAFSYAKPSAMMPELQGRLATVVTMDKLTREDLATILRHTEFSVLRQQAALLKASENIELVMEESAVDYLAKVGELVNARGCNTGARRLQQLVSVVLEEVKYQAAALRGERVVFDEGRVRDVLLADKVLGRVVREVEKGEGEKELRKFVI